MIGIDYHKIYHYSGGIGTMEPNYIKAIMPMDLPDGHSGVDIWFHRLPLLDGSVIENAKIECTATSPVEFDGSGFRSYGYVEAPSLENKELIDMSGEDARLFLVTALLATSYDAVDVLNYIDTTDYYLD